MQTEKQNQDHIQRLRHAQHTIRSASSTWPDNHRTFALEAVGRAMLDANRQERGSLADILTGLSNYSAAKLQVLRGAYAEEIEAMERGQFRS